MDSVGRTALAVAAVRAAESRRADPLFHDPFAASFVAEDQGTPGPVDFDSPDLRLRALLRGIVIRTRFFDDLLVRAARQCPQVVLLGAGLDARAFRLTWPDSTTLFELDTGDVLEWKQRTLDRIGASPTCRRVVVPIDLRDDWPTALSASGHRADMPTTWLTEGLLVYLDAASVEVLLRRVGTRSSRLSRLALTVRMSTTKPFSDLWQSHAPEDPIAWLATHGLAATLHHRGQLAATYGRHEWSGLGSPMLW